MSILSGYNSDFLFICSNFMVYYIEILRSGGAGISGFNGGHKGTPADAHAALQRARQKLQSKMTSFTQNNVSLICFFFV
jgi:hypothetical protein